MHVKQEDDAWIGLCGSPELHEETDGGKDRMCIVGFGDNFEESASVSHDFSSDGKSHYSHQVCAGKPKAEAPYDLALRCDKRNVPQIRFNDGAWHNIVLDGATLKEGPWFPLPHAGRSH